MIEDVYEPLERYVREFREKFSRLAREKFDELASASGVDADANRATVAKIVRARSEAGSLRWRRNAFGVLSALGAVAAVAAGCALASKQIPAETRETCVAVLSAGIALAAVTFPLCRRAAGRLAQVERKIAELMAEAWTQMDPLNRLYTWDVTVRLIEATVPRLAFDPYFTAARLDSLRDEFGWDGASDGSRSVVFAQSGEINGNPFVFGQYLKMEWDEKTYVGSREISWTEWETGPDGKRRAVRRYETLHASVTKPVPAYSERKVLVYGNDAAPQLSFSREPSGLRGDDGLLGRWRKGRRLKELKAFSRNLEDESQYTLMANEEFEAWFHAKDRDDEVEFRLLFTPVAQEQMLRLMKDTTVGYGDDFSFRKARKINCLMASHLDEAVIDTDPARFRHWDLVAAKAAFIAFNEKYFKDAYFALAPLLSIPLYQQTRTHADIWREALGARPSSSWEHESLANYFGERAFRHPESVTRDILKTRVVGRDEDLCEVEVAAHGYRAVDRVDVKTVFGGDGRVHEVEVPWKEYLPVERTSRIFLSERSEPTEAYGRRAAAARKAVFRRSISAFI